MNDVSDWKLCTETWLARRLALTVESTYRCNASKSSASPARTKYFIIFITVIFYDIHLCYFKSIFMLKVSVLESLERSSQKIMSLKMLTKYALANKDFMNDRNCLRYTV